MHRYFSSYEESEAYKQGEKDAHNGRHEDYVRSRYDGPTDRAYFEGYDEERKEEQRREGERQEEEREARRMEEKAREQEYLNQQYYAEQLEREKEISPEPEQDNREAGVAGKEEE